MKRVFGIFVTCALIGLAETATAQMSFGDMQKADALAKVISGAKICGYEVDEGKLEDYYKKSGLDDPEAFAYITNMISVSSVIEKPSVSECTMARVTGKKIGIIAP